MNIRHQAIVSFVALSVVLSGCGGRNNDSESPPPSATVSPSPSATEPAPTESPSTTPNEDPGELIMKQFQDQALANLPADELFASLKQKMEEAQPGQADELIRTLETYYEKNLDETSKKFEDPGLQEKLMAMDWPITEEQVAGIKDDSVREIVRQTLAGGYMLTTAEGFIFPIVDYSRLLSFGDKLSIPMRAYLDVMATESDHASASDGGLIITWDELASRTLAAESYVVTFPDSPERRTMEEQYIHYLNMYLIGLNNTPIFDYETFIIVPEVKSQYEQMVASHGKTITGQLTNELLGILKETKDAVYTKSKNGEQTDIADMKKFRDNIESTARAKLPVGKNK